MIAWPADSASKLPAVSLNRLSAPVTWRSTSSRNPMAPRTGVSASRRAASLGHNDGVVKSGSICAVSSSMASMHGPSPLPALHVIDLLRDAVAGSSGGMPLAERLHHTGLAWSQPENDQGRRDADGRVHLGGSCALVDDLGERGRTPSPDRPRPGLTTRRKRHSPRPLHPSFQAFPRL